MIIQKITPGYVIQNYNTETKRFEFQCFVAGDQTDYEDECGEDVTGTDECAELVNGDAYLPFEMKQPEKK